jgi:flagellar assembly factor FliW
MSTLAELAPETQTSRRDEVIRLPLGLLGFEHIKDYVMLVNPDEEPFLRLKPAEESKPAFIVIPPHFVVNNYRPDIREEDVEFLDLMDPSDAFVVNIVNLSDPLHKTINLKGPIVINRHSLIGKQVILANSADFASDHPLSVSECAPPKRIEVPFVPVPKAVAKPSQAGKLITTPKTLVTPSRPMNADEIEYVNPWRVTNISECYFYHKLELPGVGEVGGDWDLREHIGPYLANYDFKGKRALDVGSASGFLTYSMEKQGADVVSFDMMSGAQWDIVPQRMYRENPAAVVAQCIRGNRMLKKGYWYAHERLGSKAKAYYGDIYNMPAALGTFDVAVMGMIITHLRDAFRAIYNVSKLVHGDLIITNQTPQGPAGMAFFVPTVENGERQAWWAFTEGTIRQMVSILGFELIKTVQSAPYCTVKGREGQEPCTSFVCRRVEPI